jgi:phosphoribosylamine---glycine ligase
MPLTIGLVYDCKEDYLAAGFSPEDVLEFDPEETIAGIAAGLADLGHQVERVGRGIELARRLAAGQRWDIVFTIAEGIYGRSREAQVPAICELFHQAYTFADPLACALTLDKALAKRVVRDYGLPTAPFTLIEDPEQAKAISLPLPLFIKPVAEGSSIGVTARSLVTRQEDLESICRELLERYRQPVLVEAYLPGREVTVGIVGNGDGARVLGVMEVAVIRGEETHAYTTRNKEDYLDNIAYRLLGAEPLAEEAATTALTAYHALGCRDAARIDLRCDVAGTACFLEANPLPGLDPIRSDLPILVRLSGGTYRELLKWIISAAIERIPLHLRPPQASGRIDNTAAILSTRFCATDHSVAHRFLFVSNEGLCSELARQIVLEGGEAKLYIAVESVRDVADGFVPKTDDWRRELTWADVVVFDDTQGMGRMATDLRSSGKRVVGGTPYTDRLEDDRAFGQSEIARHGMGLIPQIDFHNLDEAIRFVLKNPACYVAKPAGAARNIKRLLFIGEDPDGQDVVHVLEAYRKTWKHLLEGVHLQQRMYGVEVAVGAFFNGTHFVEPVTINFEHKRFFPGNIGPMTGEMGTTMFWAFSPELFRHTIAGFETDLRGERFVGYFDLNCIVNREGIWPLELTTRFGFPTIDLQLEGLETTAPELLSGLADGTLKILDARAGLQIGVRLRLPPYPYQDPDMLATFGQEVELRFLDEDLTGIRIEDAKCLDGRWLAAGDVGAPLLITASGPTIREAQHLVYRRVSRVRVPNVYYRNDIGDTFEADLATLTRWGYL